MVVRQLGFEQIGTFHERQRARAFLIEEGKWQSSWVRSWGKHTQQGQQGDLDSTFDGTMMGLQLGQEVYATYNNTGHRNHYGLTLGYAQADGELSGFALGVANHNVGKLKADAYSLGGYWTHVGPSGLYTDNILQMSAVEVKPTSIQEINTVTRGHAATLSFEGGYPIQLLPNITLEPQAQVIWQRLTLNDFSDGLADITYPTTN